VIFGAIKDEKLKKNEVKVTVIATGFPEMSSNYSARTHIATPIERVVERVPAEEESVRGRIFNSLTKPREEPAPVAQPSTPVVATSVPSPHVPETRPLSDTDDEDWGAVPAFLRRSKLK
jgi:hypothetical protein